MTQLERPMSQTDADFDELFERLKRQAPAAGGFIDWVRRPGSLLIRTPLGLLLIFGGIFSFLPILGIWMLPLGLLLLALDIRPLRGPVVRAVVWIEYQWNRWRQKRQNRKDR
jgi:hypothetical protein